MESYPVFGQIISLRLPRLGLLLKKLNFDPKQKPDIRQSLLDEVLSAYQLSAIAKPSSLGGFRNESWLVETRNGKKVLKRYQAALAREQIEREHYLLMHLERKHFPAPQVLTASNGSTIVETNNRLYSLFEFIEGYHTFDSHYYYPNQKHFFNHLMGRSLRHLHLALEDLPPDLYTRSQKREGRDLLMLAQLENNRARTEALSSRQRHPVLQQLLDQYGLLEASTIESNTTLDSLAPSVQVIHGDFAPYNLVVKPGAPLIVLDFEMARCDYRMMDLVSAFASTSSLKSDNKASDFQALVEILSAYCSVSPVPESDLQAIPAVWQQLALVRLIRCWDQYLIHASERRLDEISRRLMRLQWIKNNRESFSRLVNDCAS